VRGHRSRKRGELPDTFSDIEMSDDSGRKKKSKKTKGARGRPAKAKNQVDDVATEEKK